MTEHRHVLSRNEAKDVDAEDVAPVTTEKAPPSYDDVAEARYELFEASGKLARAQATHAHAKAKQKEAITALDAANDAVSRAWTNAREAEKSLTDAALAYENAKKAMQPACARPEYDFTDEEAAKFEKSEGVSSFNAHFLYAEFDKAFDAHLRSSRRGRR